MAWSGVESHLFPAGLEWGRPLGVKARWGCVCVYISAQGNSRGAPVCVRAHILDCEVSEHLLFLALAIISRFALSLASAVAMGLRFHPVLQFIRYMGFTLGVGWC